MGLVTAVQNPERQRGDGATQAEFMIRSLPAPGSVTLILLPAVHMPARIYPLPFAQHEDFGDAAGLGGALAPGFKLV